MARAKIEQTPDGWTHAGRTQWVVGEEGIHTRDPETGAVAGPHRSPGEPVTARRIFDLLGDHIDVAAGARDVSPALIAMTVATESSPRWSPPFTGPESFRWEAHRSDYSAGPMQVLGETGRRLARTEGIADRLGLPPRQLIPEFGARPEPPPDDLPLYGYPVNLALGTALIDEQWAWMDKLWPGSGGNPILVSAAYNAGDLAVARGRYENHWGLRCWVPERGLCHLDRAAQWYGDVIAVMRERGLEP